MKKILKLLTIVMATTMLSSAPIGMDAYAESSFFNGLWGKIKAYMPRGRSNVDYSTTATIGVRGAETTESALEPYWKDDLVNNPDFKANLQSYDQAQDMCESGDFDGGISAFEELKGKVRDDLIKANVMLGLAACYGGKGDNANSSKQLKAFVKAYPSHPMAKEINRAIKAGEIPGA